MSDLALDGGVPAIAYKFPNWGDISGRDIGEAEKKLVLEVLESGHLGMVNGKKVRSSRNCGPENSTWIRPERQAAARPPFIPP